MTERGDRVVLAAVVFAVLLAQTLVYPGVDVLVGTLGGDGIAGSTLFLAVEFAAFALFAGPWGALSDRTGRRTGYVALAAAGGAVGYVTLALVPAVGSVPYAAVLALRGLQGAATVGAFTLAMSTLADLGGGNGRNMGTAGIAVGLGTALGAPLGGRLYGYATVAPLVVAAALLAVVAGLVVLVPDRAPDPDSGSGPEAGVGAEAEAGADHGLRALVDGLRRQGDLLVPYAFGFADRFSAGFFALVGTLYFRAAFGLGPEATGALLAAFFGPFALLQYPFGLLSDRIGRVVPVAVGSAAYGLAVVAVGVAPTVPAVAAAMALVGVLGALMAPATLALVVDLAGPDQRGVAVAGFNAAGSLGFLVGTLVGGGVASEYGFLAAFVVAGGVELLLATAALPALSRMDPTRERVFG